MHQTDIRGSSIYTTSEFVDGYEIGEIVTLDKALVEVALYKIRQNDLIISQDNTVCKVKQINEYGVVCEVTNLVDSAIRANNYNELTNKPFVNGVELRDSKNGSDYKLQNQLVAKDGITLSPRVDGKVDISAEFVRQDVYFKDLKGQAQASGALVDYVTTYVEDNADKTTPETVIATMADSENVDVKQESGKVKFVAKIKTDDTIDGNGTLGNPLRVAEQVNEVKHDNTLSGTGTKSFPLSVNFPTFNVNHDASLIGTGRPESPLSLNRNALTIYHDETLNGTGSELEPLSVTSKAMNIYHTNKLSGNGSFQNPLNVVDENLDIDFGNITGNITNNETLINYITNEIDNSGAVEIFKTTTPLASLNEAKLVPLSSLVKDKENGHAIAKIGDLVHDSVDTYNRIARVSDIVQNDALIITFVDGNSYVPNNFNSSVSLAQIGQTKTLYISNLSNYFVNDWSRKCPHIGDNIYYDNNGILASGIVTNVASDKQSVTVKTFTYYNLN